MCKEILEIITNFLSVILEVGAIIFGIIEFSKFKREKYKEQLSNLRKEVAAYYCMADSMADEIRMYSMRSKKTIKSDHMNRAVSHSDNLAGVRPSKTAKEMYKNNY